MPICCLYYFVRLYYCYYKYALKKFQNVLLYCFSGCFDLGFQTEPTDVVKLFLQCYPTTSCHFVHFNDKPDIYVSIPWTLQGFCFMNAPHPYHSHVPFGVSHKNLFFKDGVKMFRFRAIKAGFGFN